MLYNQPFDQPGNPNASYVNGNPGTGTPGSIPPAAAFENPQRELVNLLTDAGLTPTNADLHQVAKAIQSGALNYGIDTGPVNALATTFTPAIITLKEGMSFIVKVNVRNTGPSTFNAGAGGNLPILHVDGSTLADSELYTGGMACFVYDTTGGNHYQLAWSTRAAGGPTYLNASRDYYVDASIGLDTADGTSATITGGHGPWLTLQHAMNFITQFNLNGFNINIHVANGTYAALTLANISGSGNVNWIGNSGSPSSCVISGSSKTAIYGGGGVAGSAHTFNGFKLTTTGTPGGSDLGCHCFGWGSGITTIQNMEFGASIGSHIVCGAGQVHVAGNITISGSPSSNTVTAGAHLEASSGGVIITNTGVLPVYSITTSVAWPAAFAVAGELSVVDFIVSGGTFSGAGSATGSRYRGAANAIINSNGGGANYFPGNSAGSLSTGAQYT